MSEIASQITSLTIVYSTVLSGADQSKHQSSASLAFVWEIHRWPVNFPHKWPVTRKIFPFDDVIMIKALTWTIFSRISMRILMTLTKIVTLEVPDYYYRYMEQNANITALCFSSILYIIWQLPKHWKIEGRNWTGSSADRVIHFSDQCLYFDWKLTEVFPNYPINNRSALVQAVAWWRFGGKSLPKPIPAGTRRNNNVIMTLKRRHDVVLTS